MAKFESFFTLSSIQLNRKSKKPLFQQLYDSIREAILKSRLKPGTRLPPTRILAKELNVARNTVVFAFEQLNAEGYLEGKVGAGSYVTNELPEEILEIRSARHPKSGIQQRPIKRVLSGRGTIIDQIQIPQGISRAVPFRSGVPAIDLFPFDTWQKLISRRLKLANPDLHYYQYLGGYGPLKESIAEYLGTARGVNCCAEQVIIVNGSQQAFQLISMLLTDPGDAVFVENPCYPNATRAFEASQLHSVPVEVDKQGIDLNAAKIEQTRQAKLIYTTPSFQYPLGIRMGLSRRIQLLELAQKYKLWIIEDDYDSEYRYQGQPFSALQGLDQGGNVLYVGTFSKVLFPALRIGYVVVPGELIDVFNKALTIQTRGVPMLNQAVLNDFITEGYFARHIRKMRLIYAERQNRLVERIQSRSKGVLNVEISDAGLHLIGWLPFHNDSDLSNYLKEKGLVAASISQCSLKPTKYNGLILGYAGLNEAQIDQGVDRLAVLLDEID